MDKNPHNNKKKFFSKLTILTITTLIVFFIPSFFFHFSNNRTTKPAHHRRVLGTILTPSPTPTPSPNPIPTPTSEPTPRVFLLDPKVLMEHKARLMSLHSVPNPAIQILNTMERNFNPDDQTLEDSYNALIKQANALLKQKPVSVMDKTQVPPSGDKHDYMSLSPYYWPDPKNPSGPYIAKDGQTNPEVNSIPDLKNYQNMTTWVHKLALAYYFSGDETYASHAADFLRTWFINDNTKMNPNLNFAQGSKGRNYGSSGGIIDTFTMPYIIDSIGLLNTSQSLSKNDKEKLQAWFTDYLNWLLTNKFGIQEGKEPNNHGTWYDAQVVSIALFLHKNDIANSILEDFKTKKLPNQIAKDGSQPMELNRTKSWVYSVFNLQGLCQLAILGNKIDNDLWNYQTSDGKSVKKAINFLVTYAVQNEKWTYKQIESMNRYTLLDPLRQAAEYYKDIQYWDNSLQIEGSDAEHSIDNLLYQKPTF